MATETTKTAPVSAKITDTQFSITQTFTTTSVEDKVLTFTKDNLVEQRANIVKQRDAQIAELQALKAAELADIDAYLAEAEKLGIKLAAEVVIDEPIIK
jgi:hypothetical protein